MFYSTHDFISKIQEKKSELREEVSTKPKTATTKGQGSEVEVEHSISQGQPQQGKVLDQYKVPKAKAVADKGQGSEVEVDHSISQENKGKTTDTTATKSESLSESIFALAGIENILVNDDKKEGACGALDIIKNYSGGSMDPQNQEFIDMFQSILKDTKK